MSKRSHMLSIQSTLAAIVVITNISLTIWATGAHKPEQGTGTLWDRQLQPNFVAELQYSLAFKYPLFSLP